MEPFVANTDSEWFDYLASRTNGGIIDEVNFWQPTSTRPMRRMLPGDPVFFRLKSPRRKLAGFGFFAHHHVLSLEDAWEVFDWKNGDPDRLRFFRRIGGYRGLNLLDPRTARAPLGCTILRDARFWEESQWLPWAERQGWKDNIVQGRTESGAQSRVLATLLKDGAATTPAELAPAFRLVDEDSRRSANRDVVVREGQGAFKLRLLGAYAGRCAITGEHTEPVLDAAHIQPYLGPSSNHPQNGILLTKEFHTLFDRGYVTVTPDHVVRVSPRLHDDWNNGKRYYAYDGKELVSLPKSASDRPSPDALRWHATNKFRHAS